jgi:hypothetical protein
MTTSVSISRWVIVVSSTMFIALSIMAVMVVVSTGVLSKAITVACTAVVMVATQRKDGKDENVYKQNHFIGFYFDHLFGC